MTDKESVDGFGNELAARVAAGALELAAMKRDPSGFLQDLEAVIELGDELLRASLRDEDSRKRIWFGILNLTDLRKVSSPLWQECEPVIRRFWGRVTSLGIPHDPLLRAKVYEQIFGEEK